MLGALMVPTILWSFLVRGARLFERPEEARILFWHLPCAIVGSLLLAWGSWLSRKVLQATPEERAREDVRAVTFIEVGLLFSVLTMVTGILFSYVQWRSAWSWDPRQTSYGLVLLIYFAYFALRGALPDADRRAQNSAAYALAAVLPMIFLTYVFPRLPAMLEASNHPTQTISGGLLKGSYAYVAIATVLMTAWLALIVVNARLRAGLLELNVGYLEARRRGAPAAVVRRPVALPGAGG